MARSEARLAVTIWSDPDFLALSATAQRMFMFLLSQPDLAHDGVIALRERRWSKAAAGLSAGQVTDDLTELEKARFIVVDDDAEELLVRSFIRRDKVYRQPNVLRAAADHLKGITSGPILAGLAAELDRITAGDDIPAASAGILAEMRRAAEKGYPQPLGKTGRPNPSVNSSTKGSDPNPSESDVGPTTPDVFAGDEGSGNPSGKGSGNPTPGTPGERGVVTAVTTASPSPVPRASDPRPQSSTGGRASAREAPPPQCPEHVDDPAPPPCGRCADARKARDRWDAAAAARERAQPRCRQHRGQPAHNCALCRSEQLADQETT